MDLTFLDEELHRLCCRRNVGEATSRRHAAQLRRLMTEIACAETLAVLDALPHVDLVVERELVAVCCEPVEVLLALDGFAPKSGKPAAAAKVAAAVWSAKSARVAALSIAGEDFNPQGAKWPQ
jgi:hypothetical protein